VPVSLFTDFENFTVFNPSERLEGLLTTMLDQVIAWGAALRTVREAKTAG